MQKFLGLAILTLLVSTSSGLPVTKPSSGGASGLAQRRSGIIIARDGGTILDERTAFSTSSSRLQGRHGWVAGEYSLVRRGGKGKKRKASEEAEPDASPSTGHGRPSRSKKPRTGPGPWQDHIPNPLFPGQTTGSQTHQNIVGGNPTPSSSPDSIEKGLNNLKIKD